ncbi:MAG: hypothetical protein ACRD0U_02975, partial [Acidimicrobiales bacterium]
MKEDPLVAVEPVASRPARRRFIELPWVLHGDDPRWAPPLASFEQWRLDPYRNPFLREGGEAELLLARRAGRVVGRISAHVAAPGAPEGWFGFFDTADDGPAVKALVEGAAAWLAKRGCASMTGPASFTPGTEAGVLVEGFDVPGTTGRPWQPPWCADHLVAAGLTPAGDQPRWRLDPAAPGVGAKVGGLAAVGSRHALASHTGRHGDPRLVLQGDAGTVAAVPDLSGILREAGGRSALALARHARHRQWEGCTVVVCDGDPAVLVPGLCRAAAQAGYQWVVAPWAPDNRPPETVH